MVGASRDPAKLGYGLARNLVLSDYPGAVHFVNPAGGELFDRRIHQTVDAVPDPVDLAVVLVPAPTVPDVLESCADRGIRAVIVGSGGFRETGPEGAALEARIVEIARRRGMRLLGPNCIGVIDTHVPVDTTFLQPPGPLPGSVAFVSHSGAICAAVVDWARGQGFGLSRLISLGNQADVCETDVLAPIAADPHTKVITLYLEGVGDGRRFVEECTAAGETVPIVALKVGRFEAGRRAVASHTGALAGREAAFDAAFRRSGVIRATTAEEMFDWARALAWSPLPSGRRVAVLTNAGGPGVTAADALEAEGLEMAVPADETVFALSAFLPAAASLHNPVDMLASASPEDYARGLQILLADEGVDAVMVVLPTPPLHTSAGVVNAVLPVIHAATKPVVFALMGERFIAEAAERLRAARVPEYRFPERAASALAVLARRAERLATDHHPQPPLDDIDRQAVTAVLDRIVGEHLLDSDTLTAVLTAYGIPVVETATAPNATSAVEAARRLGYPVVMKIDAGDISHKSDAGGVMLGLSSDAEVEAAFDRVVEAVRSKVPDAEINGVVIQPMVDRGAEVIVGTVRDDQFGPMVMFGAGGVEVEARGDVAFALAPIANGDIDHLLSSTWAGRRLAGFRNVPPSDRQAVVDAVTRLAQLAADHPRLAEIEINPLVVGPSGGGAVCVDARAVVSG